MDIHTIIETLKSKGIIAQDSDKMERLSGGTTSEAYVMEQSDHTKIVIKLNAQEVIESEAYFLNFYEGVELVPDLLYVDPSHAFIVYFYLTGATGSGEKKKKELLVAIVHGLLNHYRPVSPKHGWGWQDDPNDSWQSFLLSRVNEAEERMGSVISEEDTKLVKELAGSAARCSLNQTPFLLHGDCGVHNFLFTEDRLSGIIDPTPVIGDPLYDLIYAFCSSPDELTKETILSVVNLSAIISDRTEQQLVEEVLIGLYLRIGTCIKHHPNDLQEYLKAWTYWKEAWGRF